MSQPNEPSPFPEDEAPRETESSPEPQSPTQPDSASDNRGMPNAEQTEETAGPLPVDSPETALPAPNLGAITPLNDKWLEAFYKECGREITLAYTTLNQMKNFAMIAVAAAISGIAFSKDADRFPDERMFVGVVIVYVFVLRFFFRAIICYINLTRWNNLQNACMQLSLLPDARPDRTQSQTEKEALFRSNYQNFYLQWLSPISRSAQVASNLKLGFGLLFALPILFGVWGVVSLWKSPIVEGMTTFALGITSVEVYDFFVSETFDNVKASLRRKSRHRESDYYPTPAARWLFALQWLIVALISVSVALIREHQLEPRIAAPPMQSSRLIVTSEPTGAAAYIDGIQKGTTPLSIEVTPGTRTIEVRQNGFIPSDISIVAGPNLTQSVLLRLRGEAQTTTQRPKKTKDTK
jgi:hypothetical protein